jgi:hypothetical protein
MAITPRKERLLKTSLQSHLCVHRFFFCGVIVRITFVLIAREDRISAPSPSQFVELP